MVENAASGKVTPFSRKSPMPQKSQKKKMTREQRRMRTNQIIFMVICLLVVLSMVIASIRI
jgi:predicted nucleic acid-binding Zn ribbon protein